MPANVTTRELKDLLRAADRLTDEAVAALLREFATLRGEIERALSSATELTFSQMSRVRGEIDSAMRAAAQRIGAEGIQAHEAAFLGGLGRTQRILYGTDYLPGAAGFLVGPSGFEQQALATMTFDRITAVTEEMRAAIQSLVTAGYLGQRSPFDVMTDITHIVGLRDLRGFRQLGTTGVSYKAERILRTELMTAQNAAANAMLRTGAEDMARRGVTLKKLWLSTGDLRTRWTHLMAHGQVVPVDQPFTVGGAQGMYPLDPNLPPGERINCRCRAVPWNDEWGVAEDLLGTLTTEVKTEIRRRREAA